MFSAHTHSDQGSIKHKEKLFLGNILKILDLEIFGPSHSRYVPLKAELPLPSSSCKGEACLLRSHFQGKPRVQNRISKRSCEFRKSKKIFSAHNDQGSMKHEQE